MFRSVHTSTPTQPVSMLNPASHPVRPAVPAGSQQPPSSGPGDTGVCALVAAHSLDHHRCPSLHAETLSRTGGACCRCARLGGVWSHSGHILYFTEINTMHFLHVYLFIYLFIFVCYVYYEGVAIIYIYGAGIYITAYQYYYDYGSFYPYI